MIRRCPSADTLAAFAAGDLPSGDEEPLVRHLEKCTRCAKSVAQAADAALLDELRAANAGRSAEVRAAMAGLENRITSTWLARRSAEQASRGGADDSR
jgi:anti-sigma factor ChrR (cupin superfamily)